jgi:hypothetical protein
MPEGFTKRPLCPFCSAVWTDEMVKVEVDASQCWPSVGVETSSVVDITCHSCGKLIYRKETF